MGHEKITSAEEIIEDQITRMKYKIENPYYDMTDEHLLQLYKVNLLLFEENQKKINGEIETALSYEELFKEKMEICEMLRNESYELEKRRVL